MAGHHQAGIKKRIFTWRTGALLFLWLLSLPAGFISAALISIGSSLFLEQLPTNDPADRHMSTSTDGLLVGVLAIVIMAGAAIITTLLLVVTSRFGIFKYWWLVPFLWAALVGSSVTLLTTAVSDYILNKLDSITPAWFLVPGILLLALSMFLGTNLFKVIIDIVRSSPASSEDSAADTGSTQAAASGTSENP